MVHKPHLASLRFGASVSGLFRSDGCVSHRWHPQPVKPQHKGNDLTDKTDNGTESSVEASELPERRFPWRFPSIVLGLALVTSIVGPRFVDEDNSMESIVRVLTWLLTFVVLSVWWTFFSRLRWGTRFKGIGCAIGLFALFLLCFRFEGQAGNFIPQFSFRFSQSSEERALEFFAKSSTKTSAEKSDTSLESTSDITTEFPVTDADWPRFGGPKGDHIAHGETIRTDWETNPPQERWRHPVGPGWSSFAVVGDFAFTQEQRGESECVVCYDANTGEQIWVHEDEARFEETAGGPGPRATPTIHDSRLYALGATGILNCLDPRTGDQFWTTNIVEDNGGDLIEWAVAGSPVVYGDKVLVNPGTTTSFLAAYDRLTGQRIWKGPDGRAGYSTPVVATLAGTPQIVMFTAEGVSGHSIATGDQWWMFPWTNATRINASQPIVLPDESIFVSTGYGGGSTLLDVSETEGSWTAKSRWERSNKFKLKFNGGIQADDCVYGLDEGILSCFDIEEGQRLWKKGRYQFGQILMVNGQLLVSTEKGKIVLVDVSRDSMAEVVDFQAIDGKTWNHPVLNRGRLFVRNGEEAACYDLSPVE